MQANKTNLSKKSYNSLKNNIQTLIDQGRNQPLEKAESAIAKTYWQIGQTIIKTTKSVQTSYKETILKTITSELELEKTTLSRCLNFYQTYPYFPKSNLTWSHYKQLLTIKDKTLRQNLEQQAQEKNWNKRDLANAIQTQNSSQKSKTLPRPKTPGYTYKAKVIEVIDGDTLLLNIDLGFQVWKEQRVRLAEIDCPELTTKQGQDSHHFTLLKLASATTIVIQTRKIDIYGRYLAHLFYSTSQKPQSIEEVFHQGHYLNDQLLTTKLAKRY